MSSFDKKGGGLMNKSYSSKKAQGLSLDMIVVGAIGLVVLVVIITIFVGQMIKYNEDLASGICCLEENVEEKNCKDFIGKRGDSSAEISTNGCEEGYSIVYGVFKDIDANSGKVCCRLG